MFVIEIVLNREFCWKNPDTGDYEGTDPDTFETLGVVETFQGETPEDCFKALFAKYSLKGAEMQDGILELTYEGEYDYRVPVEEREPFIETMQISMYQVETKWRDLAKWHDLIQSETA